MALKCLVRITEWAEGIEEMCLMSLENKGWVVI